MSALLLASLLAAGSSLPAAAQEVHAFDVSAPDPASAIRAFGVQAGFQILASADDLKGKKFHPVRGDISTEEALTDLLAGTGLDHRYVGDRAVALVSNDSGLAGIAQVPGHSSPTVAGSQIEPAAPILMVQADAAPPSKASGSDQQPGKIVETPQQEPAQLAEVIVTATRRQQRAQDVPASLVVESGSELEHRGATELQDIVDNTPGLSNPSGGPPNQTSLTIRGVTTGTGTGLKQSTVALLYDDIPVDPGAQGGGATNLRVVDIERIEVLRGPQGTLFGSGSLSGAVRYVTNKPNLTDFSGSAELTSASTDTGAGSYNGTVVVNAPLVEDKLALRAVGYYFDDGGWIENMMTGQRDINETVTKGGRLMLAARPTDKLRIDLSLMYQDSRDKANADSLYLQPPGFGNTQVSDGILDFVYFTTNTIPNLTVQYDLDWASLVSSTTYHDRKAGWAGFDYYFTPLVTAIATGFTNIVNGPANDSNYVDAKNFSEELRLTSPDGGPLKWTVGGFFLHSNNLSSEQEHSELVVPYIGGDNIVDAVATGLQKEIAVFGEVTYTLIEKLDLTAGVRVSHTDVDGDVVAGGFIPVFSELASAYTHQNFHETDKPITPHFSIDYRLTPDLSLYVAAARGFRIGGINETGGVGGRQIPLTYGPDHLWNYETGVKGKAFDDRLHYSADVYYIDWDNLQVNLQNNLGNYTGNAGEARLKGFEGQVDSRPTNFLELGASVLLAQNRIQQGVNGLVTGTGVVNVQKGDLLPASPEFQASAYGQVDFNAGGHEAYVRLSGHYIGPEWDSFNKAGSKFDDFGTEDIRAGIHLQKFELIAFLNNASNVSGRFSAQESSTAGPLVLQHHDAYRVRPRTVGVTLRASF